MQRKKWRDIWTDEEVRQMLLMMKKGRFAKLLDNPKESSVEIYEDLSRQMSYQKMYKTARQIRDKFNSLWLDYIKLEKTKDHSKVARHANEHYDLLDAIFGRTSENEIMSSDEMEQHDPLSFKEIKPEAIEISDDSDEEMADERTLNNETSENEESGNDDESDKEESVEGFSEEQNEALLTAADISVHSDKNCEGYERIVASFTQDWKNSQRMLIEDLKRQDLRDLRTISKQFQYQDIVLRKNRLELEKTLEKDRAELTALLDTFLKARGSDIKHSQTNGMETELHVKEEIQQIEKF